MTDRIASTIARQVSINEFFLDTDDLYYRLPNLEGSDKIQAMQIGEYLTDGLSILLIQKEKSFDLDHKVQIIKSIN